MQITAILDKIAAQSPYIMAGILIFFLSWIFATLLEKILLRLGRKLGESKKNIVRLGVTTTKISILIVGMITGFGTMGINISAMVAGLGLTGFALGFAVKDALCNLLSGVLLLMYEPFTIGDWISTSTCEGQVEDINLRYTVAKKEGDTYLIPNSILFTNTIRVSRKT